MDQEGESFSFVVSPSEAGERIDRYLAARIPDASRAQVQRAAKAEALLVDGVPVKVSHKIHAGEQVEVQLVRPEESDAAPKPEDIALDVVYEDDSIIVVNKPPGMVVHPAAGHRTGTLVNALLGRGSLAKTTEPVDRPGIVHRLDKGTSGLLVCARTESAHRKLAEQLKNRTMSRVYLAVAWGHLKSEAMVFEGPIGRSTRDRKRMAVTQSGRPAKTTAKVKERFALADFLELSLESGRTHQIRVHLSNAGHPLVGDTEYGGGASRLKGIDPSLRADGRRMLAAINRPCLHAMNLRLLHPVTQQELSFSADPPADFQRLVELSRHTV